MLTLREVLSDADRRKVAIGHFNVSELVALKAVAEAAQELNLPVIIGVSEGERDFIGVPQIAALVASIRQAHSQPVFLNADHTHTLANAEEAARAGFDMILFDGSSLPLEENIRETKKAVEAVKSINPSILVEGEIGYIGTSSKIVDKVPEGMGKLTTPEEAKQFAAATGVDVVSPAVGNMHGMLRSMIEAGARKRLEIERIRAIKQATGLFMTLHGGSGTEDDDFRKAIQAGITIIHINTEIRIAWRRGLESALAEQPEEVTPYKLLTEPLHAIKDLVRARLQLFHPMASGTNL